MLLLQRWVHHITNFTQQWDLHNTGTYICVYTPGGPPWGGYGVVVCTYRPSLISLSCVFAYVLFCQWKLIGILASACVPCSAGSTLLCCFRGQPLQQICALNNLPQLIRTHNKDCLYKVMPAVCVSQCVCVCVRTCVYRCACACACMLVSVCMHVGGWVCYCTCMYMYTYVRMYICIHVISF